LRRFTGIDVLMVSKGSHWRSQVYAADAVTWTKWAGREALEVWQLVALHSSADPDSFGIGARGARDSLGMVTWLDGSMPERVNHDDPFRRLHKNLQATAKAVESGSLKRYVDWRDRHDEAKQAHAWETRVAVSDFHAWSLRVKLPLIDGWPPRPSARFETRERRWPWGSHETELLRHLASAGELWRSVGEGGLYDPEDPTTAPTNDMVEALLERRGVTSKKTRQVIATILRADDLPPGPRPVR
jgi:hypothetical protein